MKISKRWHTTKYLSNTRQTNQDRVNASHSRIGSPCTSLPPRGLGGAFKAFNRGRMYGHSGWPEGLGAIDQRTIVLYLGFLNRIPPKQYHGPYPSSFLRHEIPAPDLASHPARACRSDSDIQPCSTGRIPISRRRLRGGPAGSQSIAGTQQGSDFLPARQRRFNGRRWHP